MRVAETAMKTKGDHSDDAVLYSERLHHALTDADDATAKTHAPAALVSVASSEDVRLGWAKGRSPPLSVEATDTRAPPPPQLL